MVIKFKQKKDSDGWIWIIGKNGQWSNGNETVWDLGLNVIVVAFVLKVYNFLGAVSVCDCGERDDWICGFALYVLEKLICVLELRETVKMC
nr:hypothetical protein [Tanacetum cinerariifolium]